MVITLATFFTMRLVRKKLLAIYFANMQYLSIVMNGVRFLAKSLGLVKSQPLRRPTVFQQLFCVANRDTVPMLLVGQVEIEPVIEDGYQYFATHRHRDMVFLWLVGDWPPINQPIYPVIRQPGFETVQRPDAGAEHGAIDVD